jgi:hypothetical protein
MTGAYEAQQEEIQRLKEEETTGEAARKRNEESEEV